jgi:hypothetical protein
VRPGKLKLPSDEVAFHVDASDSDSYISFEQNGTNFIEKILDADQRDICATNNRANCYPHIKSNALNGLPVFDFGTIHGGGATGTGANMSWSRLVPPNEVFYIWADHPESKHRVSYSYGPTPVLLFSAGYRGSNTVAGTGFNLFRTSKWFTDNLYINDVPASGSTVPGDGWNLFRTHTPGGDKTYTYADVASYAGAGFGYRAASIDKSRSTPYGGFDLAEMVIASNHLSQAKRDYVNLYLKRKWFGGYPVKKVVLEASASLDVSEAPVKIRYFQKFGDASVEGEENLQVEFHSGASSPHTVLTGEFVSRDRSVSSVPNLVFAEDARLCIDVGTNAVHSVSASGSLSKSGGGVFKVAYIDGAVDSIAVVDGELHLDPLSTPAASLHVDASDCDAFELQCANGTNFVSRWLDVSRNSQSLYPSNDKYKYENTKRVNSPFLVEDMQNGLPMVDFGSMSSAERKDGWGAAMELALPIQRNDADVAGSSDECGAVQLFIVWEDHPSVFGQEYVADSDGVVKPYVGPSIFGNSGMSWRAPGGNGSGYPYRRISPGADSYKYGLKIDNVLLSDTQASSAPISPGVHLADHNIADGYNKPWDNAFSVRCDFIGGNESCKSTNGPYATIGVYGGIRLGEMMVFRHKIPGLLREQIAAALGTKWFGSDIYSLAYGFEDITVAAGATFKLPYAELAVTDLALAGVVSAKSVKPTVFELQGSAEVQGTLVLENGASVVLGEGGPGSLYAAKLEKLVIGRKGTIDISKIDVSEYENRTVKVFDVSDVDGSVSRWRSNNSSGYTARLKLLDDGVYAIFSCGLSVIVR